MKITELFEEWAKDAKVDPTQLDTESLKVSEHQAKYAKLLYTEKMHLRFLMSQKQKLSGTLEDYFDGKIDGKTINRPPFQFIVGTKEKKQRLIDTDDEMVKLNLQIAAAEDNVLFLRDVLTILGQRSYHIRNSIDYLKWTSATGVGI